MALIKRKSIEIQIPTERGNRKLLEGHFENCPSRPPPKTFISRWRTAHVHGQSSIATAFPMFMFHAGRPVVNGPAYAASGPGECSAVESFSGGVEGGGFSKKPSRNDTQFFLQFRFRWAFDLRLDSCASRNPLPPSVPTNYVGGHFGRLRAGHFADENLSETHGLCSARPCDSLMSRHASV